MASETTEQTYAAAATPWNVVVPSTHLAALEVADAADVSGVLLAAAPIRTR